MLPVRVKAVRHRDRRRNHRSSRIRRERGESMLVSVARRDVIAYRRVSGSDQIGEASVSPC